MGAISRPPPQSVSAHFGASLVDPRALRLGRLLEAGVVAPADRGGAPKRAHVTHLPRHLRRIRLLDDSLRWSGHDRKLMRRSCRRLRAPYPAPPMCCAP